MCGEPYIVTTTIVIASLRRRCLWEDFWVSISLFDHLRCCRRSLLKKQEKDGQKNFFNMGAITM